MSGDLELTGPQRRVLNWVRRCNSRGDTPTLKGWADHAAARALERRGILRSETNAHGAVLWSVVPREGGSDDL